MFALAIHHKKCDYLWFNPIHNKLYSSGHVHFNKAEFPYSKLVKVSANGSDNDAALLDNFLATYLPIPMSSLSHSSTLLDDNVQSPHLQPMNELSLSRSLSPTLCNSNVPSLFETSLSSQYYEVYIPMCVSPRNLTSTLPLSSESSLSPLYCETYVPHT